jgi:hypothetical protein
MLNPWPGLSPSGAGCVLGISRLSNPSFYAKRHQRARIKSVVGGRGLDHRNEYQPGSYPAAPRMVN